jgi:hypothetical protein
MVADLVRRNVIVTGGTPATDPLEADSWPNSFGTGAPLPRRREQEAWPPALVARHSVCRNSHSEATDGTWNHSVRAIGLFLATKEI